MEILRVENLCKTYGKGEAEVQALKNVSFSLEKGEAERAFLVFVSGRAAHSTAWPFTTSRNTRPSLSAALRQSRVRSMKISK